MTVMKKCIIGIYLMLLITTCTSCLENTSRETNESNQSNNKTENLLDEEKLKMTKLQEEVFRSYGLSEEEIDSMKSDGISFKAQNFVDAALMMLNYLEEKYGEKFKVVGGDIPGILSDEYWITAVACEGEHAGEKFDVYYRGKDGYADGYITLLKQEEACETLKELILSKFNNVLIFPYVSGEYGEELKIDNTGEEMLRIVHYDYNIILTDSDLSEGKFNQITIDLMKFLNDNEVISGGPVRYLNGAVNLNMTLDDLDKLLDNDGAFLWNDYIMSGR